MRRRLVLVAILLVLAGCSDVSFGGSGPEAAPGDTVTPVPVTETEATPNGTDAGDDLPPGVDADGDVDPAVLWASHVSSLGGESYTWTVRFENGGSDGRFVRRALVDGETFRVEQTRPEPGPNTSLYVNESGGFLRSVAGGETSYERLRVAGGPEQYVFADEAVRRFLDGPQFDVTTVERRGETYYRLHAARGAAPAALDGPRAEVTNYTATAYVAPEGFVRTLAVEYDRLVRGHRARVSLRFDYSDVGSTAPVPPEWVSNVSERTTPVPTDRLDDGTPAPPSTPTSAPDRRNATATVGGP